MPNHDGLIVERLKKAGAITIGKTNTPEFGAGSQTFNEVFGATLNPYDITKTCGGSSGGAAVALACGMLPIADGSDTGGSLRNPANFCNVVRVFARLPAECRCGLSARLVGDFRARADGAHGAGYSADVECHRRSRPALADRHCRTGALFWMIDGYTTSDRFPYSAPMRRQGTNYIRNSVKAVVDAYNGTVDFYMSDPEDPIVRSYQKIFPELFKSIDKMPNDLLAHIRYPEDLFAIQAQMYATYHMRDPQVFYNKEDLLSIPRQTVSGTEREMAPYYTIMRLPGETKEEFVLLLPFTPNRRDNMRAWLAARSDPPHYGKLTALDFPKAKLVYGPKQIDARIEQDAFISQQLSLWGQRGQVIRGSLLAIPIEKSLLYVQPLFLAAEKGSLPELKRVIVAFGNQIAMEETLDQSLQRVFGGGKTTAEPTPAQAAS